MASEELKSRAELLFENGRKTYEEGKGEESLELFYQVLDIYRQNGDKDGEIAALGYIAVIYRSINKFEKSVETYTSLLKIFEDLHDVADQGKVLNNIGLISARAGNYEDALKSFNRALDIFKAMDNKHGVADQLGNIGSVYRDIKQSGANHWHFKSFLGIGRGATVHIDCKWDKFSQRISCSLEREQSGNIIY